jgi:hypothetical protein
VGQAETKWKYIGVSGKCICYFTPPQHSTTELYSAGHEEKKSYITLTFRTKFLTLVLSQSDTHLRSKKFFKLDYINN